MLNSVHKNITTENIKKNKKIIMETFNNIHMRWDVVIERKNKTIKAIEMDFSRNAARNSEKN